MWPDMPSSCDDYSRKKLGVAWLLRPLAPGLAPDPSSAAHRGGVNSLSFRNTSLARPHIPGGAPTRVCAVAPGGRNRAGTADATRQAHRRLVAERDGSVKSTSSGVLWRSGWLAAPGYEEQVPDRHGARLHPLFSRIRVSQETTPAAVDHVSNDVFALLAAVAVLGINDLAIKLEPAEEKSTPAGAWVAMGSGSASTASSQRRASDQAQVRVTE